MTTRIPEKIALVGGGNMANAIITGFKQLPKPPAVTISEPDAAKRAQFSAQGHRVVAENAEAAAAADVIVLAIKPQVFGQVAPQLAKAWSKNKLLISILAGMPTVKLEQGIGNDARVVRAMPNTPMAIGLGMVGLCRGKHATATDLDVAEALFAPCAKILKVAEDRMDAITAVSGSGPAYFFRFAEALLAGAMKLGFSREEAALLIGTTGAGSWPYLLQSGFEAAKLREQVTSPGGTTAAALDVINASGFDDAWAKALAAAEKRGKELAK